MNFKTVLAGEHSEWMHAEHVLLARATSLCWLSLPPTKRASFSPQCQRFDHSRATSVLSVSLISGRCQHNVVWLGLETQRLPLPDATYRHKYRSAIGSSSPPPPRHLTPLVCSRTFMVVLQVPRWAARIATYGWSIRHIFLGHQQNSVGCGLFCFISVWLPRTTIIDILYMYGTITYKHHSTRSPTSIVWHYHLLLSNLPVDSYYCIHVLLLLLLPLQLLLLLLLLLHLQYYYYYCRCLTHSNLYCYLPVTTNVPSPSTIYSLYTLQCMFSVSVSLVTRNHVVLPQQSCYSSI